MIAEIDAIGSVPEPAPGKERKIARSAVFYEAWVGPEGDPDTQVYLLFGYKPKRMWWEVPGGKIEMDSFTKEAQREFDEEVIIEADTPARIITPLNPLIGDGRVSDLVVVQGNKRVTSHPFVVRAAFDELPTASVGPSREHKEFVWGNITEAYSEGNPGQATMSRLFGDLSRGDLKELTVFIDPVNSSIVHLRPRQSPREKPRTLVISPVTAQVAERYFDPAHALAVPPGFTRPR